MALLFMEDLIIGQVPGLLSCSGLVQKLHDPTEVGLLSLLLFDLSPIHGIPSCNTSSQLFDL